MPEGGVPKAAGGPQERVDWRINGVARLKCKVGLGLWAKQYAVVIEFEENGKGRKISTTAHESQVRVAEKPKPGERVDGELRVRVVRPTDDHVVVRLPEEAFNSGPTVTVPKALILGEIPSEAMLEGMR